MIAERLAIRRGVRLAFQGEAWSVREVVYDTHWRAYFAVDSDAGEHAEIAADGSTGAYQLLEREAEPQAPPVAARDSDSGRPAGIITAIHRGDAQARAKAPTDLAETLAPSPAAGPEQLLAGAAVLQTVSSPAIARPIPDRFAPRAWRP